MQVTIRGRAQHFRTVAFDAPSNEVRLIEQRLLPHQFEIVATRDFRETARAITDMIVRGAPAIAATAAYGLAQGALAFRGRDLAKFTQHVARVQETLRAARPTANPSTGAAAGSRKRSSPTRCPSTRNTRASARCGWAAARTPMSSKFSPTKE